MDFNTEAIPCKNKSKKPTKIENFKMYKAGNPPGCGEPSLIAKEAMA